MYISGSGISLQLLLWCNFLFGFWKGCVNYNINFASSGAKIYFTVHRLPTQHTAGKEGAPVSTCSDASCFCKQCLS